MNLGDLIKQFTLHPPEALVVISSPIRLYPGRLISYRGRYEQLAIEPSIDHESVTVAQFLKTLEGAIGKVFTGYKGGDYTMHEHTPVWIAEYGESSPWSGKVTSVTNLWDSYARIDWRHIDD